MKTPLCILSNLLIIVMCIYGCLSREDNDKVLFTACTKDTLEGFRVIYRPNNHTVTDGIPSGIVHLVLDIAVRNSSETRQMTLSTTGDPGKERLIWISNAEYYYYEDCSESLETMSQIVYSVTVLTDTTEYDRNSTYIVPEDIYYCKLDNEASTINTETWCSKSLDIQAVDYVTGDPLATAGMGRLFSTYLDQQSKDGISVVYRPENHNLYSPKTYVNSTAYIVYNFSPSEDKARFQIGIMLRNSPSWRRLIWSAEGDYYYYTSAKTVLNSGSWLGYSVVIVNNQQQTIYTDTRNAYKVPESIAYCELEKGDIVSHTFDDTFCSNVLNIPVLDGSNSGSLGEGNILVSALDSNLGLLIIYKPDQPALYSSESLENNTEYILYRINYTSEDEATESFQTVMNGVLDWKRLNWSPAGAYFYHELTDLQITLTPKSVIAYSVVIINEKGELIYKDLLKHHQLPANVTICSLDKESNSSTGEQYQKCSDELRLSAATSTVLPPTSPTSTTNLNAGGVTGVNSIPPTNSNEETGSNVRDIALGVIFAIVLIVLVPIFVMACRKRSHKINPRATLTSDTRNARLYT